MNKKELQSLEDAVLQEYRDHKRLGGFDVHAGHISRLYELLALIAQHLNKKPRRKSK